MTARMSIVAALCLCGGVCCAAFSCLDAERAVRRTLAARGICQGFDAETGVYTVIASAAKRGVDPESSTFCAQQSACFRLAELKAIHRILNMRAQTMSGGTSVQRDPSAKSARTFVETLSQNDLDGCLLVGFDGRVDGDGCVAAVAMSWSEELARRARASAAGILRPADSWVDELRRYMDTLCNGMWPPTVSFIDSAGFLHRVGVGAASLAGESAPERNTAACLADLWARKNLQLALYGRAAMRKKAELMMKSSQREDFKSLASAYEALGEVSAEGSLPLGAGPLFDKVIGGQNGSSKSLLIVYGVKAPRHASAYGMDGCGGVPTMQSAPGSNSGVMIFNPNTGRYERRFDRRGQESIVKGGKGNENQ